MRYPNITLCPKNADAVNLTLILDDMGRMFSENINFTQTEDERYFSGSSTDLTQTEIEDLIAFALAGAGFDNFDPYVEKWDRSYIKKLAILFQKWKGNRDLSDFYFFLFEEAGFRCEDLFIECYYAGDLIPCCDVFRFSYVMLRGRCLKLREFYQNDPALTGTLTLYMRYLPSNIVLKGHNQPETILYISDEYPDVATFPRFYLEAMKWNQLHLQKRVISMLPNNPHCSNETTAQGEGTCFVNKWLEKKVVHPLNCTLFYLQHKYPKLPVCNPEKIVETYSNVISLAIDNNSRCFPACYRRGWF
ncbi:hypothetical protein FO519_007810 [Halicephalobus sp. NKZ332]|nr:hypothetical protein FO519_007810 [Halicephalobus sp. NKZ332]